MNLNALLNKNEYEAIPKDLPFKNGDLNSKECKDLDINGNVIAHFS